MADIPAGAWMFRYYDIDIEREALPNLKRWYDALSERAAFSSTVQTSYDELRVA
jgi:glutathione S-transferase